MDPFGADDTPPDTPRSSSPARVPPLGDRVPTLIAKGLSFRDFDCLVKGNRTATGDGRSGGGGDVEMGTAVVGMTYTTLAGEPIEEVPLWISSAAHHPPHATPHANLGAPARFILNPSHNACPPPLRPHPPPSEIEGAPQH